MPTMAWLPLCTQQKDGQWQNLLEMLQAYMPCKSNNSGEELLQQTNGHNHAVDETDSRVEQIRSNLRKRTREEVVPIPSIYNDALIELSTQHDHPMVAPKLPSFTSLKSSLYQSRRSRMLPLPKSHDEITLDGDWMNT